MGIKTNISQCYPHKSTQQGFATQDQLLVEQVNDIHAVRQAVPRQQQQITHLIFATSALFWSASVRSRASSSATAVLYFSLSWSIAECVRRSPAGDAAE
jgi:hypothetical protein